ncbi:globin [Corynebacterium poyangense]|uniref:Globin n=1 Tax=Corynebacterium poyangense TaxID=2684405 RepID=A0A7H0SQN1_9CORY|nr:globin [Corynebacterium poyangense]MBZ8178249.1 globin [Corynebacterium poyangense]QNQ90856.1 globin [Corynebacterium poyangense]
MDSLYHRLGDEAFERLVAGFYARVKNDDILSPMYPHDDWEGAQWRLRAFLTQYWGGPKDYSLQRGHPRLRMRHAQFPIDHAAASRWLELMEASLSDIEEAIISDADRAALRDHWQRAAAMLINKF